MLRYTMVVTWGRKRLMELGVWGNDHTAAEPTPPGFLYFKATCYPPMDDTSFLWHVPWVSSACSTGWYLTTVIFAVLYDLHSLLFPAKFSIPYFQVVSTYSLPSRLL